LVSVIVVNYNSHDRITRCVTSIFNGNSDVGVIVVDNASTDESLSLLESSFPDDSRLQIVRNQRNLGFAVGCNIGARLAKGQCLLYLNPDCLVDENTIRTLQASLEKDPTVGMVGGLLLNPDGTEQVGARRAIPTPGRTMVSVFNLSGLADRYPRLFSDFNLHRRPLPDQPIEVEAISGACMLVRREALEDVGELDEGYFLHCEDLDWCMRFRQKGWKIQFAPDARVTHYLGTCSRTRPVFVEWNKHKGMMRFYRKFFRHQYPGVLMWLVGIGIWLRFGLLAMYYKVREILFWVGRNHG